MTWLLLTIFFQTGVDAGPAAVSCDGSVVTLQAVPVDPPANYQIQWDANTEPGVFLSVNPSQTTSYRVVLTDLDTMTDYEDTARVLVHPTTADLFPDGVFDAMDWLAFYNAWGSQPVPVDADPDGDNAVTILDYFYFCNLVLNPPNTPPSLTAGNIVTYRNETATIPFEIDDAEQTPLLLITATPQHGSALLISGQLRYLPQEGYIGPDTLSLAATDGLLTTPDLEIAIEVLEPDDWNDLYNDIFWPRCRACHIEATSAQFSLATYEAARVGGVSGTAGFIPGSPGESSIYLRTVDLSMPQIPPPLSAQEIDRIRLWILRGADPGDP